MGRLALAALLLPVLHLAAGQFSAPSKPSAPAVKSDLPYIRCSVCEAVAKQGYRKAKVMRDGLPPGKKLKELDVLAMVEKLTDPAKDEGEWIAMIDLIETGDALKLVEQEGVGKCEAECKTIQRAAEEVTDTADTDMAEKLWQGRMNRSQFTNWLCQEATRACRAKPPKLPKDRAPGPVFVEQDPQEAQMAKMMASMKEMGMGGQIFDRETAMKKYSGAYDEDADYYDEDEGFDVPSPKAAKAAKGHSTLSLASQATEAAQETAEVAKKALASTWTWSKRFAQRGVSGLQSFLKWTGSAEL